MSLFQNRKIFEAPGASEHRPASSGADKTNSPAQVSEIRFAAPLERGTGIQEVHRASRDFQILLHTRRLYHHTHPKNLQSLEATSDSLQRLVQKMGGLEIRVEREALVVPKLSEAPLPDPRGELRHPNVSRAPAISCRRTRHADTTDPRGVAKIKRAITKQTHFLVEREAAGIRCGRYPGERANRS